MQKDYYGMTDKQKLIYVLEDVGADILYSGRAGGTVTLITNYNSDTEIEFNFNKEGEFTSVVVVVY